MISVGIFTGYYPYNVDEVIKRIKASDFNCVQLDVSFKDCDAAKGELTKEKAIEIRNKFRDANLPVICVSGYTNFIHPDPVIRQKNIDYIKTMIHFAKDLGCPMKKVTGYGMIAMEPKKSIKKPLKSLRIS